MIHVVLVAHENPEQTVLRWTRDVRPGVVHVDADWRVTCVDNSARPSQLLHDTFKGDYLWQNGRNLMYGPSLNLAVPRYPSQRYVLYACTKHGRALDNTWVRDLLDPLERWPTEYGAAGHMMGSNSPEGVAAAGGPGCEWVADAYRFDDGVRQHVQGGVFMARTALMLQFPYPPQFPHLYTDHLFTWAIMKAGYRCYDVPSLRSVWRETIKDHMLTGVKYVHAENFT